MPIVGLVEAITRAGVSGWAVNPDDPATPAEVGVTVNGQPRVTGVADQSRPGLAAATRGRATDRCGFRFEFEPPLSAFHEFRIEVIEPTTGKPLPSGVQTLARPSRDATATLSPIVVTASGGEAVTRLLGEFARHPAIIIADRPPYETRQIAYYAGAFAALTVPAARPRPTPPDTALAPAPAISLGGNPHNSPALYDLARPHTLLQAFYETRVPAHFASLFRTLILEFYETLRAGQGSHAAPYFCERGNLDSAARQAARLFFPQVKELVIVRDPRDMLAAAVTTFKVAPEAAMAALRGVVANFAAIRTQRAPDTLVLRHEDLLLEPAASRRAIGTFLGLDLSAPEQAAEPASEPALQVGRWRQELSAEQVAACEAAFAAFMMSFDYKPAQAATSVAAHPTAPVHSRPEPPQSPAAAATAPRLTLAAEGATAVAGLRALDSDLGSDGRPMKPALKFEFGIGQVGMGQLGTGWSRPEQGFVWSVARQCELTLPPLPGLGLRRVWLAATPLLHPDQLPAQLVTVLVNGAEIGTVAMRGPAVLAFDLPASAVSAGGPIAVTLLLPNATKPSDLGPSVDERQLGISLRWLTVLRSDLG
jgi:hypothetical protein